MKILNLKYVFSIECMWRVKRSSSRVQNRWFSMYLVISQNRTFLKYFIIKIIYSGFGCKSEYRYLTKKECTDALKVNICKKINLITFFNALKNYSFFITFFSTSFSYFHSLLISSCAYIHKFICIYVVRFFLTWHSCLSHDFCIFSKKKGRANDICSRAPCLNGGTCTQVSFHPGFKCKCEGIKIEN